MSVLHALHNPVTAKYIYQFISTIQEPGFSDNGIFALPPTNKLIDLDVIEHQPTPNLMLQLFLAHLATI